MSTKFNMTKDIAGYNGFGLVPADDKFEIVFAVATVYTVTVPSNYENWIAIMNYTAGADIWVAFNGVAAVPAIGVNQNGTELNPVGRQLKAGDTISLITADASNPACSIL